MTVERFKEVLHVVNLALDETYDNSNERSAITRKALVYGRHYQVTIKEIEFVLNTPINYILKEG